MFAAVLGLAFAAGCSDSDSSKPAPSTVKGNALVANGGSQASPGNTLSVVSLSSMAVTDTVTLTGQFPWKITVSPDGKTAYVSCRGTRNVADPGGLSVVDLTTNTETAYVDLTGTDPGPSVLVGTNLYVVMTDYNGVDTNTMISVIDLTADPPVESSVIVLDDVSGALSMVASADGAALWVGDWDAKIMKVDLTADPPTQTDYITPNGWITAIHLAEDGLLYVTGWTNYVPVFDTLAETWIDPIYVTGFNNVYPSGFAENGDDLALAASWDVGGICVIDRTTNWNDFGISADDDDYFPMDLPFTFTFDGADYTTAYVSSNGHVDFNTDNAGNYDFDVGGMVGFAPFIEDLDSDDGGMFAYSAQVYADHAVFAWDTATNGDASDPSAVCTFEVVLFANGKARFDYMGCGPNAIAEDDGYIYGVGDGSGTELVDMQTLYGSAFDLAHRSFLWDPATPTALTEVAFTWEGTGVKWVPTAGLTHDLAYTGRYYLAPVPKNDYGDIVINQLAVVDAETFEVSHITVGDGPRAVAAY